MNLDFTGSTLFLVLLLFAAGLVCIIKGGDFFVDAATWIAEASGIPKFIIGATVVSFATTMPEMLVSVFSALEGNADIAVGNAVGSVTANTGLIMCLSLICMECTMPRRQYAVKAVLLLAAIAILFGFTRDGQLSIVESVVILVIFVCFVVESLVAARREQTLEGPEADERPKTDGRTIALNIGKFVFGAAAIVLGAQLLIDNGTALAQMVGVPDAIIGATMIAIGTSLPELVTTITAIRKKQSSLSVGNIIGANIMDLTLIMPLCALILGKPLPVERQGMLLDIPGVAGIKMSDWNIFLLRSVVLEYPEKVVYSGFDEMLVPGLLYGADGCIGTWANLLPDLYAKVYARVRAGGTDAVKPVMDEFTAFLAVGWNYGIIDTFEELMRARGYAGRCFRRPSAWEPGKVEPAVLADLLARLQRLEDMAAAL